MSRASVVWSRSRSSSAAADARAASSSWATGDAEDAVEVGALVAERQLEDVAAVAGHDRLGPPDERVELVDRVGVVVVVDAAEAQEHRVAPAAARRGTRRAPSASARRPRAGSTARTSASSSAGGSSTSCVGTSTSQWLDDAERPPPLARRGAARGSRRGPRAPPAPRSRARPRPCRRGARPRRGRRSARPASTSISWISGSPTTNRRACPTATATFSASWTVVPPGVRIAPTRAIASCIASAGRGRPAARRRRRSSR